MKRALSLFLLLAVLVLHCVCQGEILWQDDFDDENCVIDSRWSLDVDPADEPNNIYIDESTGLLFFNNSSANSLRHYAHLETALDTTDLQSVLGSSYTYSEAYEHNVGIYVYYDQDNWVGFHIDPSNTPETRFRRRGRVNGVDIYTAEGNSKSNTWYSLEMTFAESEIQFYYTEGTNSSASVTDHGMTLLSSFTMPRPAAFTGPATLIYGKSLGNSGPGSTAATNPDLDNSLSSSQPQSANRWVRGSKVIVYAAATPVACPDIYLEMDFNEDCYVDLQDFARFADSWLKCNNPDDLSCWQ